ncbi:MAG: site-2 protease family protein [Planctomycetes bacterium]|nr:site-2 protease family protein [Planctomycetota bacterium]MBI3835476.1 site-2 protease family protein [Planctomycetota bacterium]
MIPTEKPLDNPINWSFRLGRIGNIDLRMHLTFLIGFVVLISMELARSESTSNGIAASAALLDVLQTYALLFLIVLLHEFGHCYAARAVGGEADQILLWPLGGLAYVRPPNAARAHLAVAAAGPLVNVAICGVLCGILAAQSGTLGAIPWNPWHPMSPLNASIAPTSAQLWLVRAFGISYFLLVINLLPIFPFDGGRILQSILWDRKGYTTSVEIATGVGMVAAIIVGLLGLFHEQSWLLIGIALIGYATCFQTRRALRDHAGFSSGEMSYDSPSEYVSAEPSSGSARRHGYFARIRARRAARRAQLEREFEINRQQQVEEILQKVSTSGLASLSPKEKRVLEDETKRRRHMG